MVGGQPLIAYTIRAALASQSLARVVVSTDTEELRALALGVGADAPFLRPADLARDDTTDHPVIVHALEALRIEGDGGYDAVAYLRPTTPLKTGPLIDNVVATLERSGSTSVRTVTRTEGIFHPYWMFRAEAGRLVPFVDGIKPEDFPRRQLLPECFRLNGLVDATHTTGINRRESLWGDPVGFVVTKQELELDIDTPADLARFAHYLGYDETRR